MFRLGCVVAGLGLALSVAASPLNYSTRSLNIRAGVVVVDSQVRGGVPANFAPYVWLNLDSNRGVKPAGWNFSNPFAPSVVTQAIQTRWSAINGALSAGYVPILNQRLSKRDAPYWEVFLSTLSDDQISGYDVLLLSVQGLLSLNSVERERLRQFMEGGGVLWVDLRSSATLDLLNGLPLPFSVGTNSDASPASADFQHPLLSFPLTVGGDGLRLMQSEQQLGLRPADLDAAGLGSLTPIQRPIIGDYLKWFHVARDNRGPIISVGRVGDGYMVVTTRGVATTLNRVQRLLQGQVSQGYRENVVSISEEPTFDRFSEAAARLVVNMVHLTSSYNQVGRGSRKSTGGPVDVGAPLMTRFNANVSLNPPLTDTRAPVVYKGLAIIATEDQILAFDVNPSQDLNGDGNPDDGVVDYGLGADYDLVWSSQSLSGPLSAPTAVEVPQAGDGARDQVAVVDGSGTLLIFNARPNAPTANMSPISTASAPTGGQGGGSLSPTFHDGLYFVPDRASGVGASSGRVWIANAATGEVVTSTAPWVFPGNLAGMGQPSGPVTVGYISISDNSGGLDRVVYVPTRPGTAGGPQGTAGIFSLWVGAKGERPAAFQQTGSTLVVSTRASLNGLDVYLPGNGPEVAPLGVKLSLIDPNGNPYPGNILNTLFTGGVSQSGGVLTFTMQAGATLPVGATPRVDYTINWGTGNAGTQASIRRGELFLPDDTARERLILNQIALSPLGTLHVVAANPNAVANTGSVSPLANTDGGTYFAFREEGRGSFRLLNRFDLYPEHQITLNQASASRQAETLSDQDELQNFLPALLGGRIYGMRFRSGPVLHDGVAYVTAQAQKRGNGGTPNPLFGVPATIVLAFQAEPEAAEIRVPEISGTFNVVQPDMARSVTRSAPTTFTVLQPNQYVYESNVGDGKAVIRLENLMPTNRGPVLNAISRSQPVIIRRSGQPDLLVTPDSNNSRWNTLLWYAVLHGYEQTRPSSLLVTGNTLFFAATNRAPSIFAGDPFPWIPRGLLLGMDAQPATTGDFARPMPGRTWFRQVTQLDQVGADINPNPAFRWPSSVGVRSFEDWVQRLFQTTLGNSTDAFGVTAGDGSLLSWGPQGLWAYRRADFVVADESRLVRMDPNGNPLWSSDATESTGTALDSGAASNARPLVRPTRAYPIGDNEMLIVDTAGDRVVRTDTAGRELRSYNGFRLDPSFLPDGFASGAPETLRQPRDAFRYGNFVDQASNRMSNAAVLEYWDRVLVADTGNRRLVEIIDRYVVNPVTRQLEGYVVDGTGNRALGILSWHSPATLSGSGFAYNSLAGLYNPQPAVQSYVFVAGVGNSMPTIADTGLDRPTISSPRQSEGGTGGILLFDSNGLSVINEVVVPEIPANVFWEASLGGWLSEARVVRPKRLNNLTSVTTRWVTDGAVVRQAIMFTDADGVFEIWRPGDAPTWVVRWMLPREAYLNLRQTIGGSGPVPRDTNPRNMLATYARRLDSGDVMVVNGFVGRDLGNREFQGEVLQINGDFDAAGSGTGFGFGKRNLGFDTRMIRFQLPPVTGARGIVGPVFADRR